MARGEASTFAMGWSLFSSFISGFGKSAQSFLASKFIGFKDFARRSAGMKPTSLELVLVSTPIGYLGSGKGGGVELTMCSLIKGLLSLGHKIILLAPQGSVLPSDCSAAEIRHVPGIDQPSWQHQEVSAPVVIPPDGVLLGLWEQALELGKKSDAVLNFSYDWLPIWLTPRVEPD